MGNSVFVSVGGLRIHCLAWPGDSARAPFVLLHGLASNARFWEMVAERLADAGHPVYVPDLRGHGLSDKPDGGYDFATVSNDTRLLVEALGLDQVILAGHSWGGMVALDYATRHNPAALAVVDGGIAQISDYPGATWERAEQALTPPRLAGTLLADFVTRVQGPGPEARLNDRQLGIVLANFAISPDGTIAPYLTFERHMRIVRFIWEYRTYAAFDRVDCPVLMVAARPLNLRRPQDEAYLELKRRGEAQARERIADLEFVWLEGADHDVPLFRPEELTDLLLRLADRVYSQR